MKKTIKTAALLASLVTVCSLFSACGGQKAANSAASASGSDEVIELKLSHPSGTDHPYNTAAEMFKEKVEEASNGSIKITVFPANQLGSQEEVTEAIQLGTIDFAVTSDDKLVTILPEIGGLGMPFLFEDTDEVYTHLNGELGDMLSKKLEEKNIIVASWLENGFRQITNNKQPITVPDDLKGIKIRTSSTKPNMEAFNTYGASATNISFGELYSALQLGTVDAQENPFSNILDKKFFEVQKYLSISRHVHTAEPMIMAKQTFNKLTKEQQQIVLDAGKEVSKWSFDNAKENYDKQLEELKELMQVNEIDREAFKEASQPVYDTFYDQYKEVIDMVRK